MSNLLDVLRVAGTGSLDVFWLPLAAWTLVAMLIFAVLVKWREGHPLIRYRTMLALLLALPVGMITAVVVNVARQSSPDEALIYVSPDLYLLVLPALPAASAPFFSFYHFLGILLFAFGAVALWRLTVLGVHALQLRRFRQRLPLEADETAQRESDRLAHALGIRRPVRVRVSDAPLVPMTFGWRRPEIVLPRTLLADADSLKLVLTHELVHVRRHDFALHGIERMIQALFAAHPLVSVIARHLDALREMACDAEVLRREAVSPRHYADLLYALLPAAAVEQRFGMGMADARNLKDRLLAMKYFSRFNRKRVPQIAAALIAVLTLSGATFAVINSEALARPQAPESQGDSQLVVSDTSATGSAQQPSEVFVIVEQMPELIGGLAALQEHVTYPQLAKRAGVQGKVFVQFVVDEEGRVVDPVVTRGIGAGCDEAALEALKYVQFKPGRQRGEPVKVKMSLPFTFKLPGEEVQGPQADVAIARIQRLMEEIAADPSLSPEQQREALESLGSALRSLRSTPLPPRTVTPPSETPTEFRLLGAHPNPFNPTTTINFALPESADVRLDVFDATGRQVETRSLGRLSPGTHAVGLDGSDLASGTYLYRITAGAGDAERSLTGQVTLIK